MTYFYQNFEKARLIQKQGCVKKKGKRKNEEEENEFYS